MPGTHLSETEKKLQARWDQDRFGNFPLLKSIEIKAPTGNGLRGIKNLLAEFSYPVTFFAGQNGSGKSTLLSLAALAYHGLPGFEPTNSKRWATHDDGDFGYYTFQDFFHRGPGDSDVSGVEICWKYTKTKEIKITKQSDKWMRYERRPTRPVEFIGLSRAIPAIELTALRNQFGIGSSPTPQPLSLTGGQRLSRALGRQYASAEVLNSKKFAIRRSSNSNGYTSFNMGTGEDALIALIARLESVPAGGLVVIEELESGLHPAAQKKIAEILIEISLERQLQIIGSTHSQHVLDQLPRAARSLVIREADHHRVLKGPSTRLALSTLASEHYHELVIVCEDEFAVKLIAEMLPKSLRQRVDIRSCGAKAELCNQAISYLRLMPAAKCLVLWDGDVNEAERNRYVSDALARYPLPDASTRLTKGVLPGTTCPELWALETVRTYGVEDMCNRFGLESIQEANEVLAGCGLSDPHAIPYELSQACQLNEPTASTNLAAIAARVDVVGRQVVIDAVELALG